MQNFVKLHGKSELLERGANSSLPLTLTLAIDSIPFESVPYLGVTLLSTLPN